MGDHTVYSMLAAQAERSPDTSALLIRGKDHSRAQLFEDVKAVAAGLRELGVERGDRVALAADNSYEHIAAWLGINAAGAIDVAINIEAKGAHLEYLIRDASPRILIGQPAYLEQIAARTTVPPERVIVIGDRGEQPFGPTVPHLSFAELLQLRRDGGVDVPGNGDPATMIYTSGTTGPSKGVLLPQAYWPRWSLRGVRSLGMTEGQTGFTAQPLFHADARCFVLGAVLTGGRVSLGQRFSVRSFWNEIRAADASYFNYLGTILHLLYAAPEREDDADNPAVVAGGGAAPAAIVPDFERRFGLRLFEGYGMTEALTICMSTQEHVRLGSVGKPVPEVEVQLVDAGDEPVAIGEVGELVIRPTVPHVMMSGYWGKPEATVTAWRNLWFHTGDTMRADEDGYLYYVGRLKDSIRRRGENVSAWEVEEAICRHPDVLTAAALGVPSPLGEEDVAALVMPKDGHAVDAAELHEFLTADLPRFAVPRFIEVVDELPVTPTQRVDKQHVRQRGITDAAWDAELGSTLGGKK